MIKELILKLLGFRKSGLQVVAPDERDYEAEKIIKLGAVAGVLPARVDLSNTFAMNQGRTMRCTAYSVSACFAGHNIQQHKDKTIFFDPDELWVHQLRNGDADEKLGATITSPLKALKEYGMMFAEKKYTISGYAYVKKDNWKQYLSKGYRIHTGGYTSSPLVNANYDYKVPSSPRGGHAWYIVGYDDSKAHFICMNSWGFFGKNNSGIFYVRYGDEKHLFRGFVLYDD